MALVEKLIADGVLRTPSIIEAFQAIRREDFVPSALRDVAARLDAPLPIGEGQTISQPWTVAFMLELLDPRPGQRVLDIGAGSGWQTALLAHVVSQSDSHATINHQEQRGVVFAVERIPELCAFGRANVAKYNFVGRGIVEWFCQDATEGLPERAPFDRIIAAAELTALPAAWEEQCVSDGIIVAPIRGSVWRFRKRSDGTWERTEYPGFAFVPFVSDLRHERS